MGLAGTSDLSTVTNFEIAIDTSETSGAAIGESLRSLQLLRLNGSVLASLRDLGTSLRNLRVLWAARCGLSDLDGISLLPSLAELYLSFNSIEDLSPLALHDLEVLDLEGNKVADESSLVTLGMMPQLHTLTLEGNPIALEPGYRDLVAANAPNLEILDDEPLDHDDEGDVETDSSASGVGLGKAAMLASPMASRGPASLQHAGVRAVTAASDPLSLADSEAKFDSPESPPNSRFGVVDSGLLGAGSGRSVVSNHHGYPGQRSPGKPHVSASAALSPSKSTQYAHEEYTIAQSLRTKGALGADAEYLLNGRSSPSDEQQTATLGSFAGGGSSTPRRSASSRGHRSFAALGDGWASKISEEGDEETDSNINGGHDGRMGLMDRGGSAGSAHTAANVHLIGGSSSRPQTASSFGNASLTGNNANGNSRPGTSGNGRPGTARSGNGNGGRPGTAATNNSADARAGSASSDLTHGDDAVLFAGNAVMALRRKRSGMGSAGDGSPVRGDSAGSFHSHTQETGGGGHRAALSRQNSNRSFDGSFIESNDQDSSISTSILDTTDADLLNSSVIRAVPRVVLDGARGPVLAAAMNGIRVPAASAAPAITVAAGTGGSLRPEPSWFAAARDRTGMSRPGTAPAAGRLTRPASAGVRSVTSGLDGPRTGGSSNASGSGSSAMSPSKNSLQASAGIRPGNMNSGWGALGLDTSLVSMSSGMDHRDDGHDNSDSDSDSDDANHEDNILPPEFTQAEDGKWNEEISEPRRSSRQAATRTCAAGSSAGGGAASNSTADNGSSIIAVLDEARRQDEKAKKSNHDQMRDMRNQLKSQANAVAAALSPEKQQNRPSSDAASAQVSTATFDRTSAAGGFGAAMALAMQRPHTAAAAPSGISRPSLDLDAARRQGRQAASLNARVAVADLDGTTPVSLSSPAFSTGLNSATAAVTPLASGSAGAAVAMPDAELVHMLKQKPKSVPQLHSRDSFRRFFGGITKDRMTRLLRSAYDGLDAADKEDKVQKRLELLQGVLS